MVKLFANGICDFTGSFENLEHEFRVVIGSCSDLPNYQNCTKYYLYKLLEKHTRVDAVIIPCKIGKSSTLANLKNNIKEELEKELKFKYIEIWVSDLAKEGKNRSTILILSFFV